MVVEPESLACACCAGELHRIGEDVAERIDIIPAQMRVLVTRRPKYALPVLRRGRGAGACAGAADRRRAADGGDGGPRRGGQYAEHLPLYRQAQIYARQGLKLDRSTLADWTGRAAWMLRPLHER